jgi:hypothetical protein
VHPFSAVKESSIAGVYEREPHGDYADRPILSGCPDAVNEGHSTASVWTVDFHSAARRGEYLLALRDPQGPPQPFNALFSAVRISSMVISLS